MSPINVPQSAANAVRGSVGGGENSLPFAAPVFYVVNGAAQYPKESGALHFGGWCTGKPEMDELCASEGRSLPAGLREGVKVTKESKEIPSYTARHLLVAPFGERERWSTGEGGKKDHTTHILALLGIQLPSRQVISWGPIILKASGWQASNLKKAFLDWEKSTGMARIQYAGGAPANFFWSAIGTFGQERIIEMKTSKANSQGSPITPIKVFVGEKTTLTEEKLTELYVGDETAEKMADYRNLSMEWIETGGKQNDSFSGKPEEPPDPTEAPPPPPESDLPW